MLLSIFLIKSYLDVSLVLRLNNSMNDLIIYGIPSLIFLFLLISISINEKRKYENGFGIGIYDKRYWGFEDGFHIDIFMGNECYEELKRRGVIGLRQRMRDGSKINVYDISKLNGLSKIGAEQLEFYRDNREKLSDLLG